MTDGQWLFIVFLFLYLLECVRWRPLVVRVLQGSGPSGGWALRAALPQLQSSQRGVFVLPLWPSDTHAVMLPWIFIPDSRGLVLRDRAEAPAIIPWNELRPEVVGTKLRLSRAIDLPMPGAGSADWWCGKLKAWKAMSEEERAKDFADYAQTSLDAHETLKQVREVEQATKGLRLLGVIILMWCFGVISVVYRWRGDGWEVLTAAAVLFVLQIVQAALFLRQAREGRQPVPHRGWKALAMALLPHLAARAADHLCENAARRPQHPLSCGLLLNAADWKRQASHFWREARYRAGNDTMTDEGMEVNALKRFFEKEGCSLADLLPAPARQPDAEAYCPRCESQFLSGQDVCRDCGGVTLIRFGE